MSQGVAKGQSKRDLQFMNSVCRTPKYCVFYSGGKHWPLLRFSMLVFVFGVTPSSDGYVWIIFGTQASSEICLGFSRENKRPKMNTRADLA